LSISRSYPAEVALILVFN